MPDDVTMSDDPTANLDFVQCVQLRDDQTTEDAIVEQDDPDDVVRVFAHDGRYLGDWVARGLMTPEESDRAYAKCGDDADGWWAWVPAKDDPAPATPGDAVELDLMHCLLPYATELQRLRQQVTELTAAGSRAVKSLVECEAERDALRRAVGDAWYGECEILARYMPPYPQADREPIVAVRHKPTGTFLRYSMGPETGTFWDVYPDDFQNINLAKVELYKAKPPRLVRYALAPAASPPDAGASQTP